MRSEYEIKRQRVRRLVKEVIFPHLVPTTHPLEVTAAHILGEPITVTEALERDYEPFAIGQPWGGAWSTVWFKLTGQVPEDWHGQDVIARIDLGLKGMTGFGGEGLLWNGTTPMQGLNPSHNSVRIASPAKGGETVELHIEAAANPYVPWGGIEWPLLLPDYEGAPLYKLDRAELAITDSVLEAAWHDLRVLYELAGSLGPDHARSAEIITVLNRVALGTDINNVRETLLPQRPVWAPLLAQTAPAGSHLVTAVGHAHIDSAWLWPLREARRKCARTFSTAIGMMDANPDYVFVCSQAQQHAWIEEDYPSLFEEMKEKVEAGQFEPVGSMWVEPDTNVPSGESLVRQTVYGKRYFLEKYNFETEDCWLPDAFGYSAALPQILREAGVRYFLTQKLSWNEVNTFPHHTFWWEGIDGSRVLAHCPPTDTYNGDFRVAQVLSGGRAFRQHGLSHRSLYAYGYGDGGGGPSQPMLDSYRRIHDLDPLPKIELGTAKSFFYAIEREAGDAQEAMDANRPGTITTSHNSGLGGLPVWSGELYLERHRGVQTTQAKAKLGNRRSEELLRRAEMWAVAGLEADYPQSDLEQAWRVVLLHQFHDILPGSSIHWVHQDSVAAYAGVRETAEQIIARACAAIAKRVEGSSAGTSSVLVFNAASHATTRLVELDPETSVPHEVGWARPAGDPAQDKPTPVQRLANGRLAFVADVPGCGWRRYDLLDSVDGGEAAAGGDAADDTSTRAASTTPNEVTITRRDTGDGEQIEMSNGLLTVIIDSDGHLSSVVDHASGREVIAVGQRGNVLQLHLDLPNDSDAWDVDQGTFDRATELTALDSIEVIENGPVRVAVRIVRSFEKSKLSQEIRLVAGSRQIDFETEVDWRERHRFLKVAFPVAIKAPQATYEVQFGYVQRPTHENTSWDAARFEVAAQRWADLSEPGAGVAILNDCKHGYDIRGSVMRLSLLRGPTWPDPEADLGEHHFAYALAPHDGLATSLTSSSSVVDLAESFNLGLQAIATPPEPDGTLPAAGSVVQVQGAMVSAVKRADRGSELIVRIWEPAGAHGRVGVTTPKAQARRTDSLERDRERIAVEAGRAELALQPFELVTLKFS